MFQPTPLEKKMQFNFIILRVCLRMINHNLTIVMN